MTTYIKQPDGSWKYQWEPATQLYAPVLDDAGNPTGNLQPSIQQTADGQPVAKTPEQLAALMDIQDHEPMTIHEKTVKFQVECGLASQNKAAAEEIEQVEALRAKAAVQAASNITQHYTPPATIQEYQQRLRALFYRVADNGWRLVSVPFAFYDNGVPKRAFKAQQIGGELHDVAMMEIREGGNPIASGDLESLEKFVAHKLHAKQIEAETEKAVADDLERKRAERHAVAMNSPEGRIRELERKLARTLGEPDPEDNSKKFALPGVAGSVVQVTVNDVPQDYRQVV